jgi:hypothetical protein
MVNYNWETIKRQYIQGITPEDGDKYYPSYQDLVDKHGCSKGAITSHSKKDKDGPWDKQRERYIAKVERKTEEKKSEIEAESVVESDLKFEGTGEKLRKGVELKIDECIEILENNDPDDRRFVKASDFKYLGDGLRDAQETIKIAQGEISERIRIETPKSNDELLNDPDYVQAKSKAMNDYYAKRRKE